MKATKITEAEIANLKISSLPTRPNAPTSFGGLGYSSVKMKEAFDKLPLYIIDRFNVLIDDLTGESGGNLGEYIQTGIYPDHNLEDFFDDLISGAMANYMTVFGESLASYLGKMRTDIDNLKKGQ